jgi:DNA polymerase-3 subunit delta'
VRFSDIRHQEPALATIAGALAADRLPHGFIFCGPSGVGKALAARALANVLLCDAPKHGPGRAGAPEPCGQCDQCRLTERQAHPDLNWFRKPLEKSELTIAVVTRREGSPEGFTINESVQFKPMQARCRVTVVEDAELMNVAAANAFLKTFEEAPAGSYLVLLVTALDRLLPTIRSRGRLVRFRALPDEFVSELLARDHQLATADAAVVARFAEGSMERAAELVRSDFAALRRKILEALTRLDGPAALKLADEINEWASEQAKSEIQTDAKVEENTLRRLYLKRALALAVSLLRDAALVRAGASQSQLMNPDAAALVGQWAARLTPEALHGAARQFVDWQTAVDRNVHNQLLMENACLELSRLASVNK